MNIKRAADVDKALKLKKCLILYGPRRVGKTTLVLDYLQTTSKKYLAVNGDDVRIQEILGSQNFSTISKFIEGYDLLFVDEAQHIPNIGIGLKLIVDQLPNFYIIATGSSSFELAGQVGEPLTGRKLTLSLFPIAQRELLPSKNKFELAEKREEYLIYGSYPEILTSKTAEEKQILLKEITYSYLFKDILAFEEVKGSQTLLNLLRLLAFQIGSEVSHTELGQQLQMNSRTVARYLDLLTKAFVIQPIYGFSRNLRKEVTKKNKYYFYDNGIRNAVIENFNSLNLRDDVGQLWENFLVMERLKKQAYLPLYANNYFWRTWDQQEIDWVEERGGKLYGYEFKWQGKGVGRAPKDWLETYPEASYEVIDKENYLDFVTGIK